MFVFPILKSAETNKVINVSLEKSFYKSQVEQLNKVIDDKNKQIKVLQQKVRRYKKRLDSLNALFNDIEEKKMLDNDALQVLKTVSAVKEEFLSCQLSNVIDEPTPKTYSPELRSFALTLHFFSSRAYEYARKTFKLALPHQKTLVRWYQ